MAKVLPLSCIARLVVGTSLLDDRETSRILCELLATDCYSAVSESILRKIAREQPERLTNDLLITLCPPHLRSLSLNACTKVTVTGIANVLSKCRHLISLDLRCCNQLMHTAFFTFLAKLAGHNLTSVNLENNGNLSSEHVRTILLQFTALKSLNVSSTRITDDAFNICPGRKEQDIKPLCSLTSIDISGCQLLTMVSVALITELFGETLKSVNISFTELPCQSLCFLSGYSIENLEQLMEHFTEIENKHNRVNAVRPQFTDATASSDSGNTKCVIGVEKVKVETSDASYSQQEENLDESKIGATFEQFDSTYETNQEEVISGSSADKSEHIICPEIKVKEAVNCDSMKDFDNMKESAILLEKLPDIRPTSPCTDKLSLLPEDKNNYSEQQSLITGNSQNFISGKLFKEDLLCSSMNFVYKVPDDNTLVTSLCDTLNLSSNNVKCTNLENQIDTLSNTEPSTQEPITSFKSDVAHIVSHSYISQIDESPINAETNAENIMCVGAYSHYDKDTISNIESSTDSVLSSDQTMPSNAITCDNMIPQYSEQSNLNTSDTRNFNCDMSNSASAAACSLPNKTNKHLDNDMMLGENNMINPSNFNVCSGVEGKTLKQQVIKATFCEDNDKQDNVKSEADSDLKDNSELTNTSILPEQRFKPCLNCVEISCISYSDKEVFDFCLKLLFLSNPNIQRFRISYPKLSDETAEYIAEHAPRLNHLALCECDALTSNGIATICNKCPNLNYINLHGVCFIQDPALFPLWSLKRITYLNLAESNITDISLRMMAQHASQLEQVDLSWCEELMTDGNTEAMDKFLKSGFNLQSIRLRHLPLSDNCVYSLAQHCLNLQKLNLSSVSCLTDSHVLAISLKCIQMKEINVSWNSGLTDISASAILRHLINVTDVVLSGIKLLTSKPFLPIIADVSQWRRCQALLRLKLQEKQMLEESGESPVSSDEEFEELFIPHRSTSYAPNLHSLDLEYCDKLNDTHLAEISAVCRGTLHITDYYGSPIEPCYIACQKGKVYKAVQFFG